MIITRQSDSRSPYGVLWETLAEAATMGADTVEFEYVSEGVEVMWFKGGTGIGVVLDEQVGGAIMQLIVEEAGLEERIRGKLTFEFEGRRREVRVETYQNFGEWSYRLRLLKGKQTEKRATKKNDQSSKNAPGGAQFTKLQGQYLAFIYHYTKIHRCPPAEADMQRYFKTTPPSIHQMVLTLDGHGLISREPGKARSIRVLIPPGELPELE